MKVHFLLEELGRSGGVATVLSYARALQEREGFETEIVLTGAGGQVEAGGAAGIPVRRLGEDAHGEADVAVATWWATAGHLWDVPARRRALFLQSVENRFYEERHFFERFAAEQVLSLPVHFIAVAGWIRDVLAELRPDASCDLVRGGIDKDVFTAAPLPDPGGPLRILVEGQASLWFKGVDRAVAAARAMTEPAEVTVVAPDPEAAGSFEGARVVGGLDPAGMAAAYAEHHVLLKLSRIEGLALAPLEAMHVGRPAVVTPYSGHDEAVVHGRSGLVVPFDDEPGTVRALDRLARDRGLLEQLSAGALETAARWPGADDAATAFANAVRGIAAAPEPDADAAQRDLQLAQRRWLELGREYGRRLDTVHWYQRALAESRRHTEELNAGLRVADTQLIDATRTIEDIKATRAYRFGVAARRFIPGRRS